MLALLEISLRCDNPERNVARSYHVAAGYDMFGMWSIIVRNGRAGTTGATRHYSVTGLAEARQIVLRSLRRRLSAPQRVGAPYRVVSLFHTSDVDPDLWIPAEFRAVSIPDRSAGAALPPVHSGQGRRKRTRIRATDDTSTLRLF